MDVSPKTIIFHPCPICQTPMEVNKVEIKKELIEGQIDLEDVKYEWRHICPECEHDTTKYIKICSYCKIPDDIEKLEHNITETSEEKAYFHRSCEKKANMSYGFLGIVCFFIILAIIVIGTYIWRSTTSNDVTAIIKKANSITWNLSNWDLRNEEHKKMYEKNRDEGIRLCKEAISINPNYPDTYLVLGKIYLVEGKLQEAADTFMIGLNAAKKSNEQKIQKELSDALEQLKKKGIKPKY